MPSLKICGFITFFMLVISSVSVAQTGYYRSVVAGSGSWSDELSWEYSADNVTFGAIAAEGYPGELGIPASVLVRDADEIILDVSPANTITLLTVGEGTSGTLRFGNNTTIRALVVSGTITIANGATINTNSEALHTLSIGSNLVVNGTFNGVSSATQALNTTFTGTTGTISGSGTLAFNSAVFNRTGTTTFSINSSVANTFSITNTGTVDIGAQTLTGAGGTDTFFMSAGTFQIGSTNSFPGGFETITLSGGTIDYNGANQTIAFQESDTGTLTYNNINLSGTGTKTAAGGLVINGTISYQRPIDMGAFTHTVGGSWTQNGSFTHTTSGTVQFVGSGFQQINNPINGTAIAFGNVEVNGGGILSVGSGSTTQVAGNFTVTNSSTISSASNFYVAGNYSIENGSTFTQTAGVMVFNGTGAQAINMNNSTFISAYFDNGAPTQKVISGNAVVSNLFYVYADASVTDAGVGQSHTLVNVRIDGLINFQGDLTTSGQIYDASDLSFAIGSPNWTMNGGQINASNQVTTTGSVTINSGTFNILTGASLTGAGGTLTVNAAATLDIDADDGFPAGFLSYSLNPTSIVSYTLNGAQTVRGNLAYGELEMGGGGTKTIDGPITVALNIDLNNAVSVNAGAFTHTIRDRINNGTGSSFTSTGTVNIFASDGVNYTILNAGTYTFNNLVLDTDAQTGSYTFTIAADLAVNGTLSILNSGGSTLNYPIYSLGTFSITNDGGDAFSIGSNLTLSTAGATSFHTSVSSFASVSADVTSTILYNGATNQTVSNVLSPYGNLSFSGTGNRTANGNLDINGNLTDIAGAYIFELGDFTHTIAGNVIFDDANTSLNSLSTIVFDGSDQLISEIGGAGTLIFQHVTFGGTGTKTLDDNYTVSGDWVINVGVTVDASNNDVDLNLAGNFTNSGTFTQSNGTTTLNGSTGNQTITTTPASYFGNLTLNKTGGTPTTTLGSSLIVTGSLIVQASNEIILGNFDVTIGNDFTINAGAIWNQNSSSTLRFNGTTLQELNMVQPVTFQNLVFSNSGTKRNDNNAIDVNGNLTIESGSTFNAGAFTITVAGNWTNAGSFIQTGTVTFDGTNQTINSSSFNRIIFANSGTKTLGGAISVTDDITTNASVTFDVSASNYSITAGGDFIVSGTFNPRNGTVTFNGNTSTLNPNGSSFFNLTVGKTAGQIVNLASDLDVNGNLLVQSGELELDGNDLFLAGGLTVSGSGLLDVNNATSDITLNGSSGTHDFTTNGSVLRTFTVNASGATYNMGSDLTMLANNPFVLTAGTFNLNSHKFTLQGTGSATINGGTFTVNENAILEIPNNQSLTNNGGVFQVVGTAGNPARVQRQGATGGYTITQTLGTFHAAYYEFFNTITNGITISGGSIDATNNFSHGTFSNGAGNQYLDVSGITIAGIIAEDVTFGAGPTSNVTRTSGTGTITFEDATGALAGEAYDNDGGALIDWTFPDGMYWDGGGDAVSWSDDLNWSGNTKPTSVTNIFLNHDFVPGVYSVVIDSENAEANRLTLDAQGGATITLTLTAGFDLEVTTNATIGVTTTLAINDASSILSVAESFENAGTLTFTNGILRFNGTAGSHTISTGGQSLYNLEFDADGATYTLGGALDVNNDITITAGLLDVSNNNYAITIGGDWSNMGLSTFAAKAGTVTFDLGGTTTQTISGGPFYNLTTTNGTGTGIATKQLTGNVDVNNALVISANTILDAQTNNLFVGGSFTNNSSTSAFTQTGTGTVIFDGATPQTFGAGSFQTTFNNITLSGTSTVTLAGNVTLDGNFIINGTVTTFSLSTFVLTANGGSNTFTVSGATNVQTFNNNFPTTFETVSLASNSTVQYRSNNNETIYSTTYGNLTLLRNNAGNDQTKTAAGDLIVLGALTVNDTNTEFDLDGHKLTLAGNLAFPAGGRPIVWNGGTFEHNGANINLDVDITEMPTIIWSGTGIKTLLANINVTGDVTVQTGVTFRMSTFTVTGTGGVQAFNVDNGATLDVRIPTTTGVAFPTGFDTYALGVSSNVLFISAADQTVYTGVTYGNVSLQSGGTVTLDGDWDVDGDITSGTDVINDANFDMELSGSTIQLTNYTASGGTTLTFDGTAQSINDASANTFNLQNVIFGGSGTKTLADANDTFTINGNFTINSDVTVLAAGNISYAGATFLNNGIYTQSGNGLTFNSASPQSIVTNATTTFNNLIFSGGGTKTFTTFGALINGTITVNVANTVDLGAFDYTLAYTGANFVINGTLTSANANITLTGANPDLPANLEVNDLTINSVTDTDLLGDLTVNGDLTNNSQFDINNAAYILNLGGNFINNGTFNDFNSTVNFDGALASVTIQTNGNNFHNLNLSPSIGTIYTLTSAVNLVERELILGSNATLDVNGQQLTLGSNIAAGKTATINGTLILDANSSLIVDNNNTAYAITVNGTLEVVGTNGNNATITSINQINTRRTALTISATGTIEARYYTIEYLDNNGLVLTNGATVDATNNFSDGSWANLVTAAGGPYYYLQTNEVAIPGTISNVSFDFGATPTVSTHFNVQRSAAAASNITFGGVISGVIAGDAYEDDAGDNIDWPVIATATWTGNFNSDWNEPANWSSSSVPTSATDVTIPLVSNNPKITTANAECKDLTITNGALTLENGFDLAISGSLTIGTATNAGALVVASTTSEISVAGNWLRGSNGIFTNGNSTVTFNAGSGSVSITPLTSAFNHVVLNGDATFMFTGNNIDINGNFTITQGIFNQATNAYFIYLAGNFNNTGGSMTNTRDGTFVLDGATQTISGAAFDRLTVSGTLIKTLTTSTAINDNLVINSTLATGAGVNLDINGTVNIAGGGTLNDSNAGTHTVAGASWTNSGNFTSTGTIVFDGAAQTINASNFNGLEFAGTNVKTLAGNLSLTGDLMIRSGFTRLDLATFTVSHSGSGTMTVEAGQTIYVSGSNNFPSGFANYALAASSITEFRSSSDQTIRGGITYGNVVLVNANVKSLGGNIVVQTDLTFNAATLDVTTNNYSITIGDDWNNLSTGSFIARLGDVVFNGSDGVDIQQIRSSLSGTKTFYKITVNKSAGTVRVDDQNILIADNLTVSEGTFNPNTFNVTIGGSLDVTNGALTSSGSFIFTSTSGSETIRTNGSGIINLTINGTGTTFTVQDALSVTGNFNLTAGTFDGNGNYIALGNDAADVVTIDGTYIVGANGTLALGVSVSLTVNATGVIQVVGTSGNLATVTRFTTGAYAFQVNGTIHARHYLFEYMDANGIVVNTSATIDGTNNFSDGTFTNGVSGGTLLRIENTQTLTIDNVSFPTNPGGSATNVTKIVGASGVLTFDNSSGTFSGESYDDDPTSLIDWPTPITLTWTGGTSSNWFTASNWSASSGPNIVPTGAEDVIIAVATNQPIINATGALAKNLTINSTASLTLNSGADDGIDLQINSNLTINGTLSVTNSNDQIGVAGSWTRAVSGTFTNGSSKVTFNAPSGSFSINNGVTAFYNVEINATATYSLLSVFNVTNNFTITSGTFDVSATNYAVTVGNAWSNLGTFTARAGTVTLNRSTAGTVNLNNGGSSFFNLTIAGGASTTFAMATSNLTVTGSLTISSSTFDLNGLQLVMGDGTGTDNLTISGTLIVDENAQLRLGANASVQVQSGGIFRAVGVDDSNVATVTRNSTGTYTFVVSSGATIHALNYAFSYMDANGIQIQAGATINATNNFSEGSFSNGTSGGRYLQILSLTTNIVATNVVFNSGPAKNVRATSGTGNYIQFEDASGLLIGPTYEDDDANSLTGAVRWVSTSTTYTWTGALSTDWNTLDNWDDGVGIPVILPTSSIDVIIPNVTNDPIISAANADAKNVTIQAGGVLTLNTNRSLTLAGSFTNGGTFTIPGGSTSTLSIGNTISNSGTISLGSSSTVEFTATTGVKTLAFGSTSLNNLTFNGAATFNLNANLDVNGNLTITAGVLDVTASNFQINVAGNWSNSGTFTARSGRVIFDGTGAQNINAGGTASQKRFYNFRIAKSNTATLTSDLYVTNNVELNSGSFNMGAFTMETLGAWTNTSVTVTPATSTVVFSGGTSTLITSNAQSFNNLTISKTTGFQVSLSGNTTVNGNLTVTSGTLLLNGRTLNFGDDTDVISVTGILYVDAGSVLGMHQNASATVNSGGTLRITGLNASSVATVSRQSVSAGWNMTVNGTLRARYAVFEYSGSDGITIGATGTLHATDNLSNTIFRNGIGTSYITFNQNQTTTITDIEINSGPTYNVSSTDGDFTFDDYSGNFSGARFENDAGVHPGFTKWILDASQTITGIGVYNFGNEFIVDLSANSGLTGMDVSYYDEVYAGNFNALPRFYRVIYTGGTATGTLTIPYNDAEVGGGDETNLKIWVNRGNGVFVNLGGVVDDVNNEISVAGYVFGQGSVESGKGGNGDFVFDGGEDFILSEEGDENSLPVELTRFEVKLVENVTSKVQLEWETSTELENYGFYVHRSYLGINETTEALQTVSRVDTTWQELVFIEGKGTTTERQIYTVDDSNVEAAGRYLYRLIQMDFDGSTRTYDPVEFNFTGPTEFNLKQNYPNPFNPITTIPYDVAKRSNVQIEVFNVIGQRVQVLVNEVKNPGTYRLEFNAVQLSSGVYIVRFVADGKSYVKKMMLLK